LPCHLNDQHGFACFGGNILHVSASNDGGKPTERMESSQVGFSSRGYPNPPSWIRHLGFHYFFSQQIIPDLKWLKKVIIP